MSGSSRFVHAAVPNAGSSRRAPGVGHLNYRYLVKDQVVVGKRRHYLVCVVDAAREDLLEGTTFETMEELKEELALYLLYYTERAHQGLGGKTPLQTL